MGTIFANESSRMTRDQYNDVEQFLSSIRQGIELWRSIEVRILAARIDNEWHNLITAVFLHQDPGTVPRLNNLPLLSDVACWQSIFQVESLDELIMSISKGQFSIQNERVHYLQGVGNTSKEPTPYGHWNYFFSPISASRGDSLLQWSTHQLTSTGDTINNHLQMLQSKYFKINNDLRALEHPVDGLDGLASLILEEPSSQLLNHSCSAMIHAPIRARLKAEECNLESGRLHFQIEANCKAVMDRCSVGYVSGSLSPHFLSGTIAISRNGWEKIDGGWIFTGDHDIANSKDLTLLLRVVGFSVQSVKIVDYSTIAENPRVASYSVFDPGLDIFKSWLSADDQLDARNFERAIARLLSFLGFQVDILSGDARLGDAVDILAFGHPYSTILSVECTTRSIGAGGKLGKLVDRTKHLKLSLVNHDVVPVIVTAISKSRLSEAEISEAAKDGIVVLARESLQSLLESLVEGSPLLRTISFIRSNIPSTNWLS